MKGQILKSGVTTFSDINEFYKHIQINIDEYQKDKLLVEIQYQFNSGFHSALLLGRERE